MSCPVWDLPQRDCDFWDFDALCEAMDCAECTAELEDLPGWPPPWMEDGEEQG